jgi:hypothetical protein
MQTVSREALAHAVQTVWMWRRSRRLEGSVVGHDQYSVLAKGQGNVVPAAIMRSSS